MDAKDYITYPTWQKYLVLSSFVERLRVKDKRLIFCTLRKTENIGDDHFIPQYGITIGEFSTWSILIDTKNRKKKAGKEAKRTVS